jgi:hypothetical protein
MKKVYWTFRRIPKDWQAGLYWPAETLNKQYWDYYNAWLTSIEDCPVEENNYIWELIPWVKRLSRLIIWEYNEEYIDVEEFKNNIKNVWAEYQIRMFDNIEEVNKWIREHTNLEEVEHWKYEVWSYEENITEPREREIKEIEYIELENWEVEEKITTKTIIEDITIDTITKSIYLLIK